MVDLRSLILILCTVLLVPASTSIGKKKPVSCYDKLVKLIKKSNFLEASGLYDGEAGKYLKLTKKELKKAAFDTEFDDSARFIIHVYMKSPKDVSMELRTIGWLAATMTKSRSDIRGTITAS